jgi:hypothetical protein
MLDSQAGTAALFAASRHRKTRECPSMQRIALSLALVLAVLTWPPSAYAGETIQSTKKLGKNYYVVRKPNSGDCKVESKKVPNDFIMVGKSPYASQKYAEAAIETFPECTSAKRKSKE